MSQSDKKKRPNAIRIIHVKGDYYDVGFEVGRTFSSLINDFVNKNETLNNSYIPVYNTPEGKKNYDLTVDSLRKNFPQYVRELEGTADGAQVPFHKLMLLHIDDILPKSVKKPVNDIIAGCSTIISNHRGQEILGHNEDALKETLNNFYFVSAHITSPEPQGKWKVKEEKFTSLCYAGTLPGFTMSYNHHGMVYSVNIVWAKNLIAGKTPRAFLMRSLCAAENYSQAIDMLKDCGTGIADGASVNMTFLKGPGPRTFYNVEVAPSIVNDKESIISIVAAKEGETIIHTNSFLRLQEEESKDFPKPSCDHRERRINGLSPAKSYQDVANILGDEEDKDYPIFRESGKKDTLVKTIATGIFNCTNLTWSLYSDNPKINEPLVVLPILLK